MIEAIERSLFKKDGTVAVKALTWIVAPTYSLTEEIFTNAADLSQTKIPQFVEKVHQTDMYIRFVNGSILQCKSAEKPENLRSRGLTFLVLEEAALLDPYVVGPVLRPAIADRRGEVLAPSTPKGMNWYYQWFNRGLDPLLKQWDCWQISSRLILPPEEIEEMTMFMTQDEIRQEIDADFVSFAGQVIRGAGECCRSKVQEPRAGAFYVLGVDLAKYMDFTVLAVFDVMSRDMVAFDRFTDIDWNLQKSRIQAVAEKYNNATIWVDSTGVGDPIAEDLQYLGLQVEGYTLTPASKKNLINSLAIAVEQRAIGLIDNPVLLGELDAYQYETSRAGNLKMNAPAGQHDDCVVATALGWWGVNNSYVQRPPPLPYVEMWV